MPKKHPLQQVMDKPLSRKQFLQYIGVMFLAVFGVTNMLSRMLNAHDQHQINSGRGSRWGGGKFGV